MDATNHQTQPLPRIEIMAVPDIPMIQTGDDLSAIIFERAQAA